MISETDLSRCNKCYKMGTSAVSRYKFDQSQESVTVQDFNCGQRRVSGCNGHYEFVLSAGANAKSVTNNLPILSVLWAVILNSGFYDNSSFYSLIIVLSFGSLYNPPDDPFLQSRFLRMLSWS